MNSLLKPIFALGILTSTAAIAASDEPRYSATYQQCIQHSRGLEGAVAKCEAAEFDRQDQELNVVYRALAKKLSSVQRTELQKSERAWLLFRDAQCNYEYSIDSESTSGKSVFNLCKKLVTAQRIKQLKNELKWTP